MAKPPLQESLSPYLPKPAEQSPLSPGRPNARSTFAALRYPNYRLWFVGQLVSLVGTWMQSTAQGYLIFELTKSPAFLGYVGFAAGIPSWLFTLYGGVIADRMSRRNLLVITQSGMMVLAFGLAALTFARLVQPWHILVFAFFLGIANAFDAPARQSFVLEMVSRQDLTNAIALNSTMFNTATAIGPAIGGLMYAVLGPAWCFTLNGASFLAVIAALLMMRLKPSAPPARRESTRREIAAGVSYIRKNKVARALITNMAVVSVFGISFVALMPAWAVQVLGGDAATNGFLQSARGVGAIIGALMVAMMSVYGVQGKLITLGSFAMPIFLLVFSAVRWLPFSLLALVGTGWGFLAMANASNALLQNQVPDELRGRVMSIYMLSFFGLMPIGSLLAGGVAEWIGEPLTVAIGAAILLVFAGLVWLRVPELRQAG
jgi:predicted MFS family arabinose efflux permease